MQSIFDSETMLYLHGYGLEDCVVLNTDTAIDPATHVARVFYDAEIVEEIYLSGMFSFDQMGTHLLQHHSRFVTNGDVDNLIVSISDIDTVNIVWQRERNS